MILSLVSLRLYFSFSVFVPRNNTQRVCSETVQLDLLKAAVASRDNPVSRVGTISDSALFAAFVNAKTLFRQASFVVGYPRAIPEWKNQAVPEQPSLVFIKSPVFTAPSSSGMISWSSRSNAR
jgi:hypothetical protein